MPYFSQPNLLAGRGLVPELFQEEVTPEALGTALLGELESGPRRETLQAEFRRIHETLRRGGAERAAAAVLDLVVERKRGAAA